nr:hypothetical protein [uncultured Bacteroides sp.]
MNKISKYTLQSIIIAIAIAGCIYGGRVEYTDDILSGMSLEKYQYIYDRIAPASRYDVVQEYMKNKKFYDSKIY